MVMSCQDTYPTATKNMSISKLRPYISILLILIPIVYFRVPNMIFRPDYELWLTAGERDPTVAQSWKIDTLLWLKASPTYEFGPGRYSIIEAAVVAKNLPLVKRLVPMVTDDQRLRCVKVAMDNESPTFRTQVTEICGKGLDKVKPKSD